MSRTVFIGLGLALFAAILYVGFLQKQWDVSSALAAAKSEGAKMKPIELDAPPPLPAPAHSPVPPEPPPPAQPNETSPAAAAAPPLAAVEAPPASAPSLPSPAAPLETAVVAPAVAPETSPPEDSIPVAKPVVDPDELPDAEPLAAATPAMPATPAGPDGLPVDSLPGDAIPVAAALPATAAEPLPAEAPAAAGGGGDLPPLPPNVDQLPPKVVVLGYNQFKEGGDWGDSDTTMPIELFDAQLRLLRQKGFEIIPSADLMLALRGESALPRRAAVITVDNGFRNGFTLAAPLLARYRVPWTFFIFTHVVGPKGKGVTWDDLKELHAEGVSIQSQTRSHQFLTRPRDRREREYNDWLVSELVAPKLLIERQVGNTVNLLAYPFGNYDWNVESKAEAAGYKAMFTVEPNSVTTETKSSAVGRFMMNQFSAKFLETYLDQPTLLLLKPDPSPGSVVRSARSEITAVLAYAGALDPASFKAEMDGHAPPGVTYDPANGRVTIVPAEDFKERAIRVALHATDADTKAPVVLAWHFYFEGKLGKNE
jgi:peptidoglycan/xylan/chitin deacetylase (PgdA/CDA1 family)